ncbi:activating transcription factor 7-interacting protein 1 isoform X3 [Colossoma macropomum]|uniref:activating transcription factor 7-interacting protein 1 isoform X3 n=1 Tax=Colossoma macropomum TaxID=42526 RepID=UPI0018649EB6|nr:activating transcription factor 7-interacting protein 1 isoform X3 [Colossoma macropomum]
MEVAVPEEPQKKIFRARKTMKMSDRQQLEALHSTLSNVASNSSSTPSSSSRPQTPLVNGTHMEDGQKVKEKEKDLQRQSPSLSDSRSPSPSVKKGSEKGKGEEKKGERKDEKKPEEADTDKMETSKSDRKGDPKKTPADQLFNGETAAMDTDGAPLDNGSAEEKEEKGIKSSSSSASGSPAAGLECDPEVKEGFLFLSEEDEGQGERDEVKEKSEEKMDLDAVKDEKKEAEGAQGCKAADSTGSGTPAAKKRSFSPEGGKDGRKDVDIKEERDGKRARVEGVELEAQLELKITANAGSRLKLEKVVQQLVEDRLRVLQLTVFDRNLKELKDRVEKIDSATKQQNALQHISTLQAKISRLSKKFGAANQATENSKKAQEAAAAKAAATTNTTTATQRIERTTLDPKQPNAPGSTSSTATPAQLKPLSTPTTPTSSALAAPAPILQILSTTTGSTPSSSTSSLTGQAQPGTLLLQTRPNTGVMNTNTATSGGQSMSIQPLLIQLPLAMANGQAGTLAGGVGLIPVSSLATVNNLNKAKTTTATTTIILQKSAGNVVSSSSPSSSSTAPQMSSGRSMYQGGSGAVSSPSAAVSVTTARTPTQCAAVVGVATASSSPATTGPAATGSAAAATCPPSASAMASKTDNQASNSTPAKSPSQSARPKSSFIDLTEDDDDVQAGRSAVQHRPSVDLPSKSRPGSSSSTPLPPLPLAPTPPARLPPEAAHTSPPQQPQLKLARVQSQNGIVLSWCVAETDRNCAAVDSYHLYAYHQDHQGAAASGAASSQSLWKKIGEVKALPLPMACTLTQFVSGSTYYFAVRAKDVYGRFGPFCEPQCTDVINPPSSGSS